MMVHLGMADGMVSGAINTTANTIRPSQLQHPKRSPASRWCLVSFLMCMPDRVHVYADCAVNPDPTAEQLADIAIVRADRGRVRHRTPGGDAVLFDRNPLAPGADVDKVRQATLIWSASGVRIWHWRALSSSRP